MTKWKKKKKGKDETPGSDGNQERKGRDGAAFEKRQVEQQMERSLKKSPKPTDLTQALGLFSMTKREVYVEPSIVMAPREGT